jgi:tetraacyldisaccharide 4'-kinase
MSLEARLQRLWYGPAWRSLPLWPLEGLFALVVALRRQAYRLGLAKARRAPVPVIIVGNLTVGGTGKTPIVTWLTGRLQAAGLRVGVALRGYGGSHGGAAQVVDADSPAAVVGDEALLHARRANHVVVVGSDRVAAVELAARRGADLVVCDDGLQHLRLLRDCEIAVVDASRGLGNGHLLPAGPLRESPRRLQQMDAIVLTRRGPTPDASLPRGGPPVFPAELRLGLAVNLVSGERRPLEEFVGRPVHAVAGIGHPHAFFDRLRERGLELDARALGDHAELEPQTLAFGGRGPLLMTEKDAVKCRDFARANWWWVELDVVIEATAAQALLGIVLERCGLRISGVENG